MVLPTKTQLLPLAVLAAFALAPLACRVEGEVVSASQVEVVPPTPATATPPAASSSAAVIPAPTTNPNATARLPFAVDLVEVSNSKLPALHSFAAAHVKDKWLLLGGRTGGLHGFESTGNNFPRSGANTSAIVVDPVANQVLGSVDLVTALPPAIGSQLTSSNLEAAQVGTDLYLVGGYGQDLASGTMTTFGRVIKIDAKGMIDAIIAKKPIAGFVKATPAVDNRLKVTGGELRHNAGIFYLVFGQDFTGLYSINNRDYNRAGGQFQKYTEKVRVFTLNDDLSVKAYNQIDGGYDPNLPYNRRDLNVVDTVLADGVTPDVMVYGGVFKAGQIAGHVAPISLSYGSTVANGKVALQNGFTQVMSHYTCASFSVFDATSKSTFTTLFGGISQYHYDATTNQLVLDALNLPIGVDGLPFVDTISTIQRGAGGSGFTFTQTLQTTTLPALLGAEAQVIPSDQLASNQVLPNGVVQLSALTGRTLVGHLYGGIQAFGPYTALVKTPPSSQASNRLFQVFVTPGSSPVIPAPPVPTSSTPYPPPTAARGPS